MSIDNMTTAIKKYESLTMIYLKDGSTLRTTLSVEQLGNELNSKEFLVIDWQGFNRYEVKNWKAYSPDDMEQFVLSQWKDVREKMRAILRERRDKELQTNGIKHLQEIYEKRYGTV